MNTAQSHRKSIRSHLEKYGSITPMEAIRLYGCYRLGARIHDLLHEEGMNIETEHTEAVNAHTGRPTAYATYQLKVS